MRSQRLVEALSAFDMAIRFDGGHRTLHTNKDVALIRLGDLPGAAISP